MVNFEVQTKSTSESTWTSDTTTLQRYTVTRYAIPNTPFQVRVRGSDGSTWTAFTPVADLATLPELGAIVTSVSQRSITVTASLKAGSGSASISDYRCSLGDASMSAAVASGGSTMSVTIPSLNKYTEYTPRCQAENNPEFWGSSRRGYR